MSFPRAALVALAAASAVLALPADGGAASSKTTLTPEGNGVLSLPLVPLSPAPPKAGLDKIKRELLPNVPLDRHRFQGDTSQTALGVALEIGTPPQTVILQPDTGSWIDWVAVAPTGHARDGNKSSIFDPGASSTFKDLGQKDVAYYSAGSLHLAVAQDKVAMSGAALDRKTFAVHNRGEESKLPWEAGILGLAPYKQGRWAESSILKNLVDAGITKTRAFGMAFRAPGRGALTFGGYDTAKFSGNLRRFPTKQLPRSSPNEIMYHVKTRSFQLFLKDVKTGQTSVYSQGPSYFNRETGGPSVFLDSGAAVMAVPAFVFDPISQKLESKGILPGYGNMLVPNCSAIHPDDVLNFTMSRDVEISIPLQEFVYKMDNNGGCILGMVKNEGSFETDFVAGTHFLRNAYAVYDVDQQSVWLARGADCGTKPVALQGPMREGVRGDCTIEKPMVDSNAAALEQTQGYRPAAAAANSGHVADAKKLDKPEEAGAEARQNSTAIN